MPNQVKKKYLYYIIKHQGGEHTSIKYRTILKEYYDIRLGNGSYGVLANLFPNNWGERAPVKIGNYCSISNDVKRFNTNHPYSQSTMSPIFYKSIMASDMPDLVRKGLYIGHDVWIGAGVKLLSGCEKIGNGAIIGAGSIVTKDIPAYTVWAGNPAKQLSERFTNEQKQALEDSRWWELNIAELMNYKEVVKDPLYFAKQIKADRK